jgi:beta-glucosidase/6-phospho-beta-glucosidase/beta-galactosidase
MKNLLLILIFLASCTAQKTEPILNENADLQTKLFFLEKNFKGKTFSDLEKDLSKQNIQVENIGMGSEIANSNKMTYLTFTFLNKEKDTKMNLNKDSLTQIKINI